MNKLTLALSLLGLAAVGAGCTVVTPVYGNCDSTAECESLADRCQDLSVTYPGDGTYNAGLCTYSCSTDSDCVTGSTSENGACYIILGLSDSLCYERCFDDLDCAFNFRCVDATDDAGNPLGDAICIPG